MIKHEGFAHIQKEYEIEEHKNRGAESFCVSSPATWMEGIGYCYPDWVHFRGIIFSSSCTVTVAQN